MSNDTIDPRLAKLPRWAQEEIKRLFAKSEGRKRERSMMPLATTPTCGRQLRPMSKDRKDVYLGDGLRRALQGRKDSLSTSVNLIADRYQGIVERLHPAIQQKGPITQDAVRVYRAVLAETRGHLLEAREIAAFPSMVADYLSRHPEHEARLYAYDVAQAMSYPELVGLIDYLERQP